MTAAQWSVVGVIFSLIVGAITLYFLARSNARENQRQRAEATQRAVDDASRPLKDQLVTANSRILYLERQGEAKDKRINELEDKLYGGRT